MVILVSGKLLGSALNLKPILEIREGIVKPVARARTRRKALATVYDLLEEQLQEEDKVHMAVIKVAAPEEAACFKEQLKSRFCPAEMLETECNPVIGAHVGPGTARVAFFVE